MSLLLPLLLLLAAGVSVCQREKEGIRTLWVNLQRNTVSAVSCPLKTTEEVTWTTLKGGQKGISWKNHLIFTNVTGPWSQLYRCQHGSLSALVKVTLSDGPLNTIEGTVEYCQHGKPCALRCPFSKEDGGMDWPGMKLEKEMWWGEEWNGVHIRGDSPVMIRPGMIPADFSGNSFGLLVHAAVFLALQAKQGDNPFMIKPGVMLADYLRNPSLLGCKRRYYITEAGHELTGLPVGHPMDGLTKKVNLKIGQPHSRIVRPIRTDISSNTIIVSASVGQSAEIECEGITWDKFDELYWLKRPCRSDDECETTEFIPEEGRLREQKVNVSLAENALARTVSTKLVFDPVEESDLRSTFYCKLDSAGGGDVLTVYLRDRKKGRKI